MKGKHVRIAIAGAGFSGVGMGLRLKKNGIEDFAIFERADDLGGTWRDNTYPGAGCDVPTHLYSYSFARNPDWSHLFSDQREILDYVRRCATDGGVLPHIHFGAGLTGAEWSEDENRWNIETEAGPISADILISCVGGLTEPSVPELPGIERFEGKTMHSARWDHDHDLAGERVAVIGTGASAAQLIPEVQRLASKLTVFQRTPAWVLPRPQRRFSRLEKTIFRRVPLAQKLLRGAIFSILESGGIGFYVNRRFMKLLEARGRQLLRSQVPDPELRRKLTPRYTIGCKRIVVSSKYYPALAKPNVEVVTDGIREITETGVVTADGTEHKVDTILFGTGFKVMDMTMAEHLRGREGRSLADAWQGFPQAYKGTTVAGFPNLFFIVGPNTGGGNNSFLYMIESQIGYVLRALKTMEARGAATLEVQPQAQAAYTEEMRERSEKTVWLTGGCKSWYLDDQGRNAVLWPNWTFAYRWRMRRFEEGDYVLAPAAERVLEPA